MQELNVIRNLIGNITLEQLKYVDYYLNEDFGIFIPSVGFCEYAIKKGHTHPSYSFTLFLTANSAEITLKIKPEVKIDHNHYLAAFLPPGIPHEEEKTMIFSRYMAIMVSAKLFEAVYRNYESALPQNTQWQSFSISKDVMLLLNRFIIEAEEKKTGSTQVLQTLSALIIHDLIRAMIGANHDALISPQESIQHVLDYIHQKYMEPLSVSDLAQLINCSTMNFKRLFKKETNTSPMQYLIKLRLEKSKKLLCSRSLNISEISMQCGFSNASHFTACFKKHFAITPSQYKSIYHLSKS